jgi:hypothetical protein
MNKFKISQNEVNLFEVQGVAFSQLFLKRIIFKKKKASLMRTRTKHQSVHDLVI